jgi:site-specific recombinase XerD
LVERQGAEIAPSTMAFYRGSLGKFLQFLGKRSDDPIAEITKQDVVAFRNSLVTQVSAKTANHDLKALKMLFKSARRDSVVAEDPTEFVETVRRERAPKIKRAFTDNRVVGVEILNLSKRSPKVNLRELQFQGS